MPFFRSTPCRVSATRLLAACFLATAACGDDDPEADPTSSTSGDASSSAGDATSSGTGGAGTSVGSTGATTSASTTSGSGGGSGGEGGASTVGSGGAGGAGGTGGGSCLDEHEAGDRYSLGDDCNFCDCNADGTSTCTTRSCSSSPGGCEYDGAEHPYGARFPSADDCNECVCAASGLACTQREECDDVPDSAILVESLDTPCGPAEFTAASVLDGLPFDDFVTPFAYRTDGPYPETLPDTELRLRIVYEDGFAVCRIPNPGQEAFDIEVVVEWVTADGSFDEGFHTYLRRDAGGFVDGWYLSTAVAPDKLDGSFEPECLDDSGFTFGATIYGDGTAEGFAAKVCETDITLAVGTFAYAE